MADKDSMFKAWYDKAMQTGDSAYKTTAGALKNGYATVKDSIDFDKDGNITFKDAQTAGTAIGKSASDMAAFAQKKVFGDDKEEGLWGAFTKNPVNMVMAGVGAMLLGLLFSEMGIIGLILAMVAGAVAFGGLSTYLNQPSENKAPDITPASQTDPVKGDAPAQQQSVGVDFSKILNDKDKVITAQEYNDTFKPTDAGKLKEGYVLLTPEYKNPTDIGPVIYAKQDGDKLTDVQVALSGSSQSLVKLEGEFSMADQGRMVTGAKNKLDASPAKPDDVSVDDIQAPLIAAVEANKKAAAAAPAK